MIKWLSNRFARARSMVWKWLKNLFHAVGIFLAPVLAVLFLGGCLSTSSSMSSDPNGVKVSPAEFTQEVRDNFWPAAAMAEKAGYKIKHKITKVDVITEGLVRGPTGQWGFYFEHSPTGIAGGTTGGNTIKIGINKDTGRLYPGAMVHEWLHAILQGNHFAGAHGEEVEIDRIGKVK